MQVLVLSDELAFPFLWNDKSGINVPLSQKLEYNFSFLVPCVSRGGSEENVLKYLKN